MAVVTDVWKVEMLVAWTEKPMAHSSAALSAAETADTTVSHSVGLSASLSAVLTADKWARWTAD